MPRYFQEQVERVDRLMKVIAAPDQSEATGSILTFEDIVAFTFQNMWHIRDWILHDPRFSAQNRGSLRDEIEGDEYLRVCADLANGVKHFELSRPRSSVSESDIRGVHLEPGAGIFQVHYYLESSELGSPFNGMLVREFLAECRQRWEEIIQRHYLSEFRIHEA